MRDISGRKWACRFFELGNIIGFNLLVWWTARLLYRIDERRRSAEEQLQQKNQLLEQAVLSERQVHQALKEDCKASSCKPKS